QDLGSGLLQYTPNPDFVGIETFTYTVSDGDLTSQATVTVSVTDPSAFNVIDASVGKENLRGTEAPDAFTFAPGTSINGAIDTIRDWAPGDVIDLAALGLTEGSVEVRTAGGGSIIKLIEGFDAGEFHVKINLNDNSQEMVLDSVIYATATAAAAAAMPAKTSPVETEDAVDPLSAASDGTKDASVIFVPVKAFEDETSSVSEMVETQFEPISATASLSPTLEISMAKEGLDRDAPISYTPPSSDLTLDGFDVSGLLINSHAWDVA
ncbi:MAG: Ig-like domain-containing protein, partial [Pseudomonadota bacterium]